MNAKPQPLYSAPPRDRCPVCGEVSYSAQGIHPQCALKQADAKRMKRAKPRGKQPKKVVGTTDVRPWQKICPKCRSVAHVRKKVCGCGAVFAGMERS